MNTTFMHWVRETRDIEQFSRHLMVGDHLTETGKCREWGIFQRMTWGVAQLVARSRDVTG